MINAPRPPAITLAIKTTVSYEGVELGGRTFMPEQSEDHQYLGDFRSHGERERLEEAKRQYAKRRAEWRRNASIPDLIRVSIREWLWDSIHYETQEKIKKHDRLHRGDYAHLILDALDGRNNR
jgi:hypothetical protein